MLIMCEVRICVTVDLVCMIHAQKVTRKTSGKNVETSDWCDGKDSCSDESCNAFNRTSYAIFGPLP